MNYLFDYLSDKNLKTDLRNKLFLIISTLFFAAAGFGLWFIIHHFIFNKSFYGLIFAGYFGLFIGLIGGILFLYNKK